MLSRILFISSVLLTILNLFIYGVRLSSKQEKMSKMIFYDTVIELPLYISLHKANNLSSNKDLIIDSYSQTLIGVQLLKLEKIQRSGLFKKFCRELYDLGLLHDYYMYLKSAVELTLHEEVFIFESSDEEASSARLTSNINTGIRLDYSLLLKEIDDVFKESEPQ